MTEPHWPNVHYGPIDYQAHQLLLGAEDARRRSAASTKSIPSCSKTYEKLGIPLTEQKMLSGVAVDAIFDSVSVGTTMRDELAKHGIIFCSFGEAVREHPELVEKYLGSVVPYSDNFFAALNCAVFSDGSFVYVPKGVRCPMELSTYFRINAADTGQFERTLIVADEGAYVSYLEGCTAPKRDTNQLHAAVVELVALEDATIKYSTVQNWYAGDKDGVGGIYNFVTKRGKARGELQDLVDAGRDRLGDHLEISERDPAGRRLHRRVLLGGGREQPPAGRHRHEDDPHRQEHEVDDHLEGHLRGPGQQHLPRPGARCCPRPRARATTRSATRCSSATSAARTRSRTSRSANNTRDVEHEASTSKIGEDQIFYLQAARAERRARDLADRQRVLQGSVQGAADGVRARGAAAARHHARGSVG